jgi:transposase
MRYDFDRLAVLAASALGGDPRSGHLFVFRSRGGDRLKILSWTATAWPSDTSG